MTHAPVVRRLLALLLSTLLILPLAVSADDDDDEGGEIESLPFSDLSFPEPEKRFSPEQGCVAPEDEMRRNHMRYILHQRDETMHRGIRTRQYALEECVNCHAMRDEDSGEFIPVNAPDQFCASCHSYASVKLDCFECHATKPVRPSRLSGVRADPDASALTEEIHQLLAAEDKAQ